ncbi:formin-J isoform X2 [Lingula anatina]|uniref:Formin-J isoform X2 n=1 Tax=Lingula anatina TaxID=7574 RepID=A0A1S3J1A1_LINAN|nr:formin-J isoform X2 [Lingula anatina]|eukprot:XP_013404038.1 formin-J isoform X2 [Lingula anatina]
MIMGTWKLLNRSCLGNGMQPVGDRDCPTPEYRPSNINNKAHLLHPIMERRDRVFKHVFKGSVLVTTLMEHDPHRFRSRARAIKFAQWLLDHNHIESIVGHSGFEDSVHLYRWSDETVVDQARKIVTNSAYIPKKRLIELVELNFGGSEDSDTRSLNSSMSSEPKSPRLQKRNINGSLGSPMSPKIIDFCKSPTTVQKSINSRDIKNSTPLSTPLSFWEKRSREGSVSSTLSSSTAASNSRQTTPQITRPAERLHFGNSEQGSTPHQNFNPGYSPSPTPSLEQKHPDKSFDSPNNNNNNTFVAKSFQELALQKKPPTPTKNSRRQGEEAGNHTQNGGSNKVNDDDMCFSDNEKTLLERMKKMESKHQGVVKGYEGRINELMNKMHELKQIAELLEQSGNKSMPGVNGHYGQRDRPNMGENQRVQVQTVSMIPPESPKISSREARTPASPRPPPPPASPALTPAAGTHVLAPPPPPPAPLMTRQPAVVPRKPPVRPRVKMRPLYWNRVVLPTKGSVVSEDITIWNEVTEPNFDVEEFEGLFGKPRSQSSDGHEMATQDATSLKRRGNKVQPVKVLEANRSRSVAIWLRSQQCKLENVHSAIYDLDFNKVDLDSLQTLRTIIATPEELEKLHQQVKAKSAAPLDEPDQFLLDLSKMRHLTERIECLLYKRTFTEAMFDTDQQLTYLLSACDEVKSCKTLKTLIELVLAFGNYMNGGTQRGQADGFELQALSKVKDIKSVDGSINLLQHIIRTYCNEFEENSGKNTSKFDVPEMQTLQQAASVSLDEIKATLERTQDELARHKTKAEKIYEETEAHLIQPFKNYMEEFFETAEDTHLSQMQKYTASTFSFEGVVAFFTFRNENDQATPSAFFGIWVSFLTDASALWKIEQRRIAREMFERVQSRRKTRAATTKIATISHTELKAKFSTHGQQQKTIKFQQLNPKVGFQSSQQPTSNNALTNGRKTPDTLLRTDHQQQQNQDSPPSYPPPPPPVGDDTPGGEGFSSSTNGSLGRGRVNAIKDMFQHHPADDRRDTPSPPPLPPRIRPVRLSYISSKLSKSSEELDTSGLERIHELKFMKARDRTPLSPLSFSTAAQSDSMEDILANDSLSSGGGTPHSGHSSKNNVSSSGGECTPRSLPSSGRDVMSPTLSNSSAHSNAAVKSRDISSSLSPPSNNFNLADKDRQSSSMVGKPGENRPVSAFSSLSPKVIRQSFNSRRQNVNFQQQQLQSPKQHYPVLDFKAIALSPKSGDKDSEPSTPGVTVNGMTRNPLASLSGTEDDTLYLTMNNRRSQPPQTNSHDDSRDYIEMDTARAIQQSGSPPPVVLPNGFKTPDLFIIRNGHNGDEVISSSSASSSLQRPDKKYTFRRISETGSEQSIKKGSGGGSAPGSPAPPKPQRTFMQYGKPGSDMNSNYMNDKGWRRSFGKGKVQGNNTIPYESATNSSKNLLGGNDVSYMAV